MFSSPLIDTSPDMCSVHGFPRRLHLFVLMSMWLGMVGNGSTLAQTPQPEPESRAIGTLDRPFGPAKQTRSFAVGRNGMAATSHPLATMAAIDVLRSGGNAVDAAIAANAVLCVAEPMSCGLGGDLFAIVHHQADGKRYGLNASGRSPASLTLKTFQQQNLKTIPLTGVLPWSVPGCVSGWQSLHEKFGSRDIKELLAPAIDAAENGFVVTPIIAGYWKSAEPTLREFEDASKVFLVDGERSPEAGEVFRNPPLARTLKRLADVGLDDFYRGRIARRLAKYSGAKEGFLSEGDLAEHRAEWVEPVSTDYRGYRVWELPPNGQGIAALQMLNVLSGYDLSKFTHGDPNYLHRLVEAKKLAFADRATYYADPALVDVPVDELISKEYADKQRARIDPRRAATDVPAGDPQLQHGDTIYLTVVDKDRNVCSLIQSTYYGFGSKMVPPELGFAIQNRGALFVLDETHANRFQPRKRPFHTIIPALVTQDNRPVLTFGVMGGDMQPQGHVQVLVNWIDFGMNIQMAGDAARVRHLGSASPGGEAADAKGGEVVAESGISQEAVAALRAMGHQVKRGKTGMGGYQAIEIDWENGTLRGATESRKDGIAIGY
ncbi:MAG: gamma-glutamyltransferase [Planctomycetota bacterium]